jgi:phage tail tape-measure protein
MTEKTDTTAIARFVPNNAGKGKILATAVAVGGKAVLRGTARQMVRKGLEQTVGVAAARSVVRGGSRVAARVAPVLAIAEFALDQRETSRAFRADEISRAEYYSETGGNAGSAAVGLAGAAAGAAIGSAILPGIGTIIGGIIGGLVGGAGGRELGRGIGDELL